MNTERCRKLGVRQRVPIPLRGMDAAVDFVSFSGLDPGDEPIAMVFGKPDPDRPVRVRLHSECLTGDVFHSLRCDCGSQLQETIADLSTHSGVLLYLRQEGRGIGLYAKLDAYQLQTQGLDTFAANRSLGYAEDLRSYADSAAMLHALGIHAIELISNNPDKARQLQMHGIDVVRVRPTGVYANTHNADYLRAKQQQHFHTLAWDSHPHDPVPNPHSPTIEKVLCL